MSRSNDLDLLQTAFYFVWLICIIWPEKTGKRVNFFNGEA